MTTVNENVEQIGSALFQIGFYETKNADSFLLHSSQSIPVTVGILILELIKI